MDKESRFKFRRKAIEKPKILKVWSGFSRWNYFQLWKFLVGIVTILLLQNQYYEFQTVWPQSTFWLGGSKIEVFDLKSRCFNVTQAWLLGEEDLTRPVSSDQWEERPVGSDQ